MFGARQGDPREMPLLGVNVADGTMRREGGQSSQGIPLRFGAENRG